MSDGAKTNEWPLVIFTLALQLSCGLALAATFVDAIANPSVAAAMRPLALAIFPAVAVGMLASLLHLGQPLAAWKSLLNLRRSRLSLEVLLTALFALTALVYSSFWLTGRTEMRLALGMATSVLGLAAVISSAMIHVLPSQPAWNSGWVPASFLGTALLLGGFASAALVPWAGSAASSAGVPPGISALRLFLGAVFAGSAVVLLSALWMLARLSGVRGEQFASGRVGGSHWLTTRDYLWFGLHVLLAGLLPAALALRFWPATTATSPAKVLTAPLALAAFLSIVLGTLVGRLLMYSLAASLPEP